MGIPETMVYKILIFTRSFVPVVNEEQTEWSPFQELSSETTAVKIGGRAGRRDTMKVSRILVLIVKMLMRAAATVVTNLKEC